MKKIIRTILVCFLIVICGCNPRERSLESFFNGKKISKTSIHYDSLSIETIKFDSINSSFDGFLQVEEDELLFFDKRFCWVYKFDLNGKLVSRYLGQGRGPGELNASYIEAHQKLNNGNRVFVGSSWDVHILDSDWNYVKRITLDWEIPDYDIAQVESPSPEMPIVYTLDYENFKMLTDGYNMIYIPIYSEHKTFNGMISEKYYRDGRILLQYDIDNNKLVNLLGRRSPSYLTHKFCPQHSFFSYDIDSQNNFYISHEIDSLIYVYNKDFKNILSFGSKGTDMNTNYSLMNEFNPKEFRRLYFSDKPTKGYYKNLILFEKDSLLFRSYSKGNNSQNDGLQIYKNKVLIGDIEVPKGFEVIGYIEPYFYSDIIMNNDQQSIKCYRFKLENIHSQTKYLDVMGQSKGILSFDRKIIDLGDVSEDTVLVANYQFKNIGKEELIIEYVNPDCICTSYFLSSDTIGIDSTGTIDLVFNTKNKSGQQIIYTVVRSNTKEKFSRLLLKANIVEREFR